MKYLFSYKCFAILTAIVALTACSRAVHEESKTAAAAVASDSIVLSPDAVHQFDIESAPIEARSESSSLTTTAEVKADENRVFHINSLSGGRVIADRVMLGDVIKAGETLAVVQNIDVAKIFGNYMHESHQNEVDVKLEETKLELAKKNYERLNKLYAEKIAAEKDLIKAQSDLRIEQQTVAGLKEHSSHIREEAETLLGAYGVKLGKSERISSESPVTSPRDGVIITKNVTVGDVISNTEPLYVVADLSSVWLDIPVYDKQVQLVRQGNHVAFESDSLPGKSFTGHIDYIKPTAEETSGRFIARAIISNNKLELKPGMFGQASIQTSNPSRMPFIEDSAIQKFGAATFVFFDEGAGHYRKHVVQLGNKVPGGYLVAEGVRPGDRVVNKGSFTLKAEMLKSTMAGEE